MSTITLWEQRLPNNWEVAVIRLPSGKYMGHMGEIRVVDTYGTSYKQEVFDNKTDAFRYVGFPVGLLPLPA